MAKKMTTTRRTDAQRKRSDQQARGITEPVARAAWLDDPALLPKRPPTVRRDDGTKAAG